MKPGIALSSLAIAALAFGGPTVAAATSKNPSPAIPPAADASRPQGSQPEHDMVGAARAVDVHRRLFDTSDSRFDQGVDNQGWWHPSVENYDDNDNYFVGLQAGRYRNFFSFDLATLHGHAVGATLVLRRYRGAGHFTETLGLFAVHTGAKKLNNNAGANKDIYRDLGSGSGYGRYVLPTAADPTKVVRLRLNGAAIADLNAARGHFFSIGGKLLSINRPPGEQFLFARSGTRGVQRLIVYIESAA